MSTQPARDQPDLNGIEGDYTLRGWTRARVAALTGCLVLALLVLSAALTLHDRQLLIGAIILLILVTVSSWRVRGRAVTTTISREGITVDHGTGQRGLLHIPWAEAQEVYVAGAWQAHSTVRTASNEEVGVSPLEWCNSARPT